MLLLQGDQDDYCPPAQARLLKDRMDAAGASCTLVLKSGHGHEPFFDAPELWAFLDGHLKRR